MNAVTRTHTHTHAHAHTHTQSYTTSRPRLRFSSGEYLSKLIVKPRELQIDAESYHAPTRIQHSLTHEDTPEAGDSA